MSEEITINDTKYTEEDFNQEQRYFLKQIRSCRTKVMELQFNIDQIKAAEVSFSNAFMTSMKNEGDSEKTLDDTEKSSAAITS